MDTKTAEVVNPETKKGVNICIGHLPIFDD